MRGLEKSPKASPIILMAFKMMKFNWKWIAWLEYEPPCMCVSIYLYVKEGEEGTRQTQKADSLQTFFFDKIILD